MKLIVFLFFVIIFYLFKAIASIGKGTIDIAKNAYETVYQIPPQKPQKNELITQTWAKYFLNLMHLFASELDTQLEKGYLSYINNDDCSSKDKEILAFFLAMENYFFTVYELEVYCLDKKYSADFSKKIIIAALIVLYNYDERNYNFFDDLKDLLTLYTFERREYYRQFLRELLNDNFDIIGKYETQQDLIANLAVFSQWKHETDKIISGFAEEEYKSYKKNNVFCKDTRLPKGYPEFILSGECQNIIGKKKEVLLDIIRNAEI